MKCMSYGCRDFQSMNPHKALSMKAAVSVTIPMLTPMFFWGRANAQYDHLDHWFKAASA